LPEDGNLEAGERKPTEEQQQRQDHQEAAQVSQEDLRDDQSAQFVTHDDTCEAPVRGVLEAEAAEALAQPPTKTDEAKLQEATPQATPRELQEFQTAILAFAQALDEDMHVGDDDKPHRANQTHFRHADDAEQDWPAPSRPAPPTTTNENLGMDLPDDHEQQRTSSVAQSDAALLPGRGTGTEEDFVARAEPSCEAAGPPSPAEPRKGEEDLALAAMALLQLMTPRIEETLTERRLCEAAPSTDASGGGSGSVGCSATAPAQDQASLELEAETKEAVFSRQDEAIEFIASHLSRLESKPGMLAKEKLSKFLQLLGMNAADIDEALDAAQVADAEGFIDYRAFMKWLLEPAV